MISKSTSSLGPKEEFIQQAIAYQQVWILRSGDDAATLPWEQGQPRGVQLFWSERTQAEQCATGQWSEYTPEPINLSRFLGMWLPGLTHGMFWQGCIAGLNWTDPRTGFKISPSELKEEIERRAK